MTTENDITRAYLEKNGYDGLVHYDTECGCGLDDLFICDERTGGCEPAYKRKDCVGCPNLKDCALDGVGFNDGCFSKKWRKR